MGIMDIFRRWFGRKAQPAMDRALPGMLRMVAITDEKEIACDEVFRLLDQFTEMMARGEDAARLLPMVQKHLELCPDCGEEYAALLTMLKSPGSQAKAG